MGVETCAVSPRADANSVRASWEQICREMGEGSVPAGSGAWVVSVVESTEEQAETDSPTTRTMPRERRRTG